MVTVRPRPDYFYCHTHATEQYHRRDICARAAAGAPGRCDTVEIWIILNPEKNSPVITPMQPVT